MSLEAIKSAIPAYAKDIKLNISSLLNEELLTGQQLWGCLLSCAYSAGNKDLLNNVLPEATQNMPPAAIEAAKSAASIMAMNNVYYKFVGMSANPDYKSMPARLRMNVIANPGVDKGDFELWSLAVSAMNGCKYCVDAHEAELAKHGLQAAHIQTAVRIAAVIAALASILSAEKALSEGSSLVQAA